MNEAKEAVTCCIWTKRVSKTNPNLFIAECNGRTVNVIKMMKRKRAFIDKCPFCGGTVNWQGAKK